MQFRRTLDFTDGSEHVIFLILQGHLGFVICPSFVETLKAVFQSLKIELSLQLLVLIGTYEVFFA